MGFVRCVAVVVVATIGCGDNIHPGRGQLVVSPRVDLATTEAGDSATFTVALTTEPAGEVTITLTSLDVAEGTVSPAELTFNEYNYDDPRTVTITGVDDLHADGNTPYLVRVDGGRSGMMDLTVTNLDDDVAGFTVTPQFGLMTSEGGQQATFTVQLTSQPFGDVTIPVTSTDDTEGTPDQTSLRFTPDDWDAPQTVVVSGVQDIVADGSVQYSVVLGAAVTEDVVYAGLDPDDLNLLNIDDDLRGFVVTPTAVVTDENGTPATFSVVLQTPPSAAVTIDVMSSDTSEATVSTAQLVFTTTNWDTAQVVTVTGANDTIVDGDQPFTIVLGPAMSGDPIYNGVDPDDVSGINRDNDTASAGISVTPTSLTTSESGTTASFDVVLLSQPAASVTIALASSDTTEGTVSNSSLLFTQGNWNQVRTVTVTGVDDLIADGNQPYTIVTAPAVSADPQYSGMNAADVAVINLDNDIAGFTVVPTSGLVVTEFLDTDTFTIKLNTPPLANVTVTMTSSDITEGTVDPPAVTFTPLNWNTPRTVTVRGRNDNLTDGNIVFSIITGAAISADPAYSGLNPPDVQVTNIDNDTPQVIVRTQPLLTVSENGTTATFRIGLTVQPSANVTCTLFSNDATEGAVSPTNIIFTPMNFGMRVVTVLGLDDIDDDGNVSFSIITNACTSADPAYNGQNPRDVSVINLDND